MKRTVLMFLILMTTLSPFTAARSQALDNGLLISHTSSDSWQIRMIAGAEARHFSGVVESSVPFDSMSAVKLESADDATLSSTNLLSATFEVWPGGSDGVDFSVSADAQLCLRDTGSSGVQIYLGDSLADAVPVSAPVALTGADSCGGTTPPPTGTTRKNHRGHYIAMLKSMDSASVMIDSIKPGVVGFMKRYTWRQLEPSLGVYDFSEIQSDLATAAGQGMHLIVMIEDKSFKMERPTPAYLDSYTLLNKPGGYTVVRWSPYVVTRWKALVSALGNRFDSNQAFEGIATQETALGFTNTTLDANGYTPEKYRDAYIDMLTHASNVLPTSRIFWFMNFFPRKQDYIASVANAVVGRGVVMGGPDVAPDEWAIQNRVYPLYHQFEGRMPLFGQVEDMCYRHVHADTSYPTKYWTMTELFRYARDNLVVNYMIWVRLPKPPETGAYDYFDALPVIANNPIFNQ
jgi:hypothetical protein